MNQPIARGIAVGCLLVVGCWISFAASPARKPDPGFHPTACEDSIDPPLRILSWNIYMLPRLAKITGKRQRAAIIAAKMRLPYYDILVFQEAFLGDARRIIHHELQDIYPYAYGPANRKFSIKTNSGIWVLSRIPLTVLGQIDFEQCEGFDDCFARKGALLLQADNGRRSFQVLGTHLQAGGPHSIRQSQMDEIAALLDRHRQPGMPQFVVGDMNTTMQDSAQYRDMLQRLACEDGPLDITLPTNEDGYPNDLHSHGVRSPRIIDYAFLRRNGARPFPTRRTMFRITSPWSPRHQDLSDHFPILLSAEW